MSLQGHLELSADCRGCMHARTSFILYELFLV